MRMGRGTDSSRKPLVWRNSISWRMCDDGKCVVNEMCVCNARVGTCRTMDRSLGNVSFLLFSTLILLRIQLSSCPTHELPFKQYCNYIYFVKFRSHAIFVRHPATKSMSPKARRCRCWRANAKNLFAVLLIIIIITHLGIIYVFKNFGNAATHHRISFRLHNILMFLTDVVSLVVRRTRLVRSCTSSNGVVEKLILFVFNILQMNSHDAQNIQNKTWKTLNADTQFYFSLFAFLQSGCDCVCVCVCVDQGPNERKIWSWFGLTYDMYAISTLDAGHDVRSHVLRFEYIQFNFEIRQSKHNNGPTLLETHFNEEFIRKQ